MGCDRGKISSRWSPKNFNPRTHVGCDANPRDLTNLFQISIHAPTWGATYSGKFGSGYIVHFNPRTHVGCDYKAELANVGVDDFNPRTHVGCDLKKTMFFSTDIISIHAPTWGATADDFRASATGKFQSTHPRGVRPISIILKLFLNTFQSTHPRGVRLLSHQMVGF